MQVSWPFLLIRNRCRRRPRLRRGGERECPFQLSPAGHSPAFPCRSFPAGSQGIQRAVNGALLRASVCTAKTVCHLHADLTVGSACHSPEGVCVVFGAVPLAALLLVLEQGNVEGQGHVRVFTPYTLYGQFPAFLEDPYLPLTVVVEHIHQDGVVGQAGEVLPVGGGFHDAFPGGVREEEVLQGVAVYDAELLVAAPLQRAQLPGDVVAIDGEHLVASGGAVHAHGVSGVAPCSPEVAAHCTHGVLHDGGEALRLHVVGLVPVPGEDVHGVESLQYPAQALGGLVVRQAFCHLEVPRLGPRRRVHAHHHGCACAHIREVLLQPCQLFVGEPCLIVPGSHNALPVFPALAGAVLIDDVVQDHIVNLPDVVGIIVGAHGLPEGRRRPEVGLPGVGRRGVVVVVPCHAEVPHAVRLVVLGDEGLVVGDGEAVRIPVVVPGEVSQHGGVDGRLAGLPAFLLYPGQEEPLVELHVLGILAPGQLRVGLEHHDVPVVLLPSQLKVVPFVGLPVLGGGEGLPEASEEPLLPAAPCRPGHVAGGDDIEHVAVPLVGLQGVVPPAVGGGKGESVRHHHPGNALPPAGDAAGDVCGRAAEGRREECQAQDEELDME